MDQLGQGVSQGLTGALSANSNFLQYEIVSGVKKIIGCFPIIFAGLQGLTGQLTSGLLSGTGGALKGVGLGGYNFASGLGMSVQYVTPMNIMEGYELWLLTGSGTLNAGQGLGMALKMHN